jgi:DNA-binding NarL/FixJ family response regulator
MKTRIYLVDDHAMVRHGLTALIGAQSDMEVCGQADSATTALQEIMEIQPDLAIVDITLGGNSGLELTKSVRAFNPKILVMVLSMHHESIYGLRALKAGARAYVMKHEMACRTIEAIRRIRNGGLFVSDDLANQMLNQLVAGGTPDDTSPVAPLSDRELEIVTHIGNGLPTREIAAKLHVSVKTVESHRAHIKEKLHLSNASQLVQFCVRWVEQSIASGV